MSGDPRECARRSARVDDPARTPLTERHVSRERTGIRRAHLIGGVAAVGLAVVAFVVVARAPRPVIPARCRIPSIVAGDTYSITPVQAQDAAIIAAVALRKGMADHAVTVALATSLQETQLRNLPYGDLDSLGLFQQRPSEGWGTRAQIMDPNYAASRFYDRLAQVSGWQAMAVTQAAQLVQRSATPDAYAAWETEARSLARALTGEIPTGVSCQLDGFGGLTPASTALEQAATTQMGAQLIGVPVSMKLGWQVASWAVAHAYRYHLTSVAFDGRRWTVASGAWKPIAASEPVTVQITMSAA